MVLAVLTKEIALGVIFPVLSEKGAGRMILAILAEKFTHNAMIVFLAHFCCQQTAGSGTAL